MTELAGENERAIDGPQHEEAEVVVQRPAAPEAPQPGAAGETSRAVAASVTASGSSTTRFQQYEEARLEAFQIVAGLGEESDRFLHPMLCALLEVEAPAHFEAILDRLRRRYGMARARESTRKHVLRSIERFASKSELPLLRLDSQYDLFLADPQQRAVPRSPGLSGPRQILHIAPAELAEGLLFVLKEEGPLYRDELILRTARRFGFDRTGHTIKRALDTAIQLLLREGRVVESYGSLRAAGADL